MRRVEAEEEEEEDSLMLGVQQWHQQGQSAGEIEIVSKRIAACWMGRSCRGSLFDFGRTTQTLEAVAPLFLAYIYPFSMERECWPKSFVSQRASNFSFDFSRVKRKLWPTIFDLLLLQPPQIQQQHTFTQVFVALSHSAQ